MTIYSLPKNVYEKIRAGEVIEDPSCVVRELIDNAIDSKSTFIEIAIAQSGLESISVKDNGVGMSREDLQICFLEHTTSKIKTIEDMFELTTLGFRGEALASIAHISKMNISSCYNDKQEGHSIHIQDNQIVHQESLPMNQGTHVVVKYLFYNTPVRKKFLNSPSKEKTKIKREILAKALGHPHIGFNIHFDQKMIWSVPPDQTPAERIKMMLKIQGGIQEYLYTDSSLELRLFLSDLQETFNSSSYLYFFVNNKPINSKTLYGVMNKVLSDLIPRGQYLAGCIFIKLHPKEIDPNIHPSKKEMKIFIENHILKYLAYSIEQLYQKTYKNSNTQEPLSYSFKDLEKRNNLHPNNSNFFPLFHQSSTEDNQDILSSYHYIGTIFKTYWLVEVEEKLLFIDFHAAHERLRYEKLKSIWMRKAVIESQILLEPLILNIGDEAIVLAQEYEDNLSEIGFEINILSDQILSIKSIPNFYKNELWIQDIKDLLLNYESYTPLKLIHLKKYFLKREACRYSFMSGDYVPLSEINTLLKLIFNDEFPHTCPHGRPFINEISKSFLESKFLRK